MKTYLCFPQDTLFMFVFLDDVKSPSCFPSPASAPVPCVKMPLLSSLSTLMWTNTCANILQKLYQLHCHLSADIRCCWDRINIIIHFMFHGNSEECSQNCLFRLRLGCCRERERGQVRHFPNAEVKNISRGLHLILV